MKVISRGRIRNCVACAVLALFGEPFAVQRALAQVVETEIEVLVTPVLDVVAVEADAKIYRTVPGAAVQLQVTARHSDGSARDVTLDPGTAYSSLSPELVSVTSGGALTFASAAPTGAAAAIVVVTRDGRTRALGFTVEGQ